MTRITATAVMEGYCENRAMESDYLLSVDCVRSAAQPLKGAPNDLDSLVDFVGDARFVLLGEASHGTHEFYRERARITKRLIREKGFQAICLEADWPDAYRVNQYVHGKPGDDNAVLALRGFERFPAWMWRNADVLDFVGWLRDYNDSAQHKVGFYGLDLYSLHASMRVVLDYLDKVDPLAAARARHRYACFESFGEDPQAYGYAARLGLSHTCESEVVAQLVELMGSAAAYTRNDGAGAREAFFSAEQNAHLVKSAEEYYRAMFRRQTSSWNLRDTHMVETLGRLAHYLSSDRRPAKLIVWAHNSHIGDARATQMQRAGQWNVGQLVRLEHPHDCRLIGFTTYTGTVTAASNWDEPAQCKTVLSARPDSYEALFHDTGISDFLVLFGQGSNISVLLEQPRLERAIGVIYRPESELASHYFTARLSRQFDAVIHLDHTRAVEPLEEFARAKDTEPAETYPSGI